MLISYAPLPRPSKDEWTLHMLFVVTSYHTLQVSSTFVNIKGEK
jgi:hypothetical protein